MGQHRIVTLRICLKCGAQELTNAEGMARHADACKPDRARVIRRRKGVCIDCGKPSLPYVKCPYHRFYDSLRRVMNRGSEYGLFIKTFPEGRHRPYYAMGDPGAVVGKRGFRDAPFTARAPRGFFPFVEAYLRQSGKPMHEDNIADAFTEFRRDRAEKGHLESPADEPPYDVHEAALARP